MCVGGEGRDKRLLDRLDMTQDLQVTICRGTAIDVSFHVLHVRVQW